MNIGSDKLFDELFKKYGGIAKDADYLNLYVEQLNDTVKHFTELNIYVNFIENELINAVAAKYNGKYFIGINVGTLSIFYYLSKKLSSHPNILSDLGESNKEVNTQKLYNSILKNALHIDPNIPFEPITKSRKLLAEFLFNQLLFNVLFHEIGHIVDGHLDFISNSSISYLEECQYKEVHIPELISLDRQTLEIDADFFSSVETLREAIEYIKLTNQEYNKILPDNDKSIIKIWSFARMLCWRLMENHYIGKDLLSITHPPTCVRHHFSIFSAFNFARDKGIEPHDYHMGFTQGVDEADLALKMISEIDPVPAHLSEELSIIRYTHGSLIFCHWNTIREKLLNYSTWPLRENNIYDDSSQTKEMIEGYENFIKYSRTKSKSN